MAAFTPTTPGGVVTINARLTKPAGGVQNAAYSRNSEAIGNENLYDVFEGDLLLTPRKPASKAHSRSDARPLVPATATLNGLELTPDNPTEFFKKYRFLGIASTNAQAPRRGYGASPSSIVATQTGGVRTARRVQLKSKTARIGDVLVWDVPRRGDPGYDGSNEASLRGRVVPMLMTREEAGKLTLDDVRRAITPEMITQFEDVAGQGAVEAGARANEIRNSQFVGSLYRMIRDRLEAENARVVGTLASDAKSGHDCNIHLHSG